jgi:hypothetical protein
MKLIFIATQSDFLIYTTSVTLYLRAQFGYDNRFHHHQHHHYLYHHHFPAKLLSLAAGKTCVKERLWRDEKAQHRK